MDRRSWQYVRTLPEPQRERVGVRVAEGESAVYLDARFVTNAPFTEAGDVVYLRRVERPMGPLPGLLIGLGSAGVVVSGVDTALGGLGYGTRVSVVALVAGLIELAAGVVLAGYETETVRVADGRDGWIYVDPCGLRLGGTATPATSRVP